MTLSPARNAVLLIICFVAIIGIIFAGAWFYKYSSQSEVLTVGEETFNNEVSQFGEVAEESVILSLVPTANAPEYQLVLSGLSDQLTTVAFQLVSADAATPITATTIEVTPELRQSGWSTALNTQSSTESQQSLSFSLLRSGPSEDPFPTELTLGSIQLNANVDPTTIQLDSEESFVTYLNSENPVRIILGTNNAVPTVNE